MKVIQVEKLEECINGDHVFHFDFDCPWTKEAILKLASIGKLDYFPDFPRPFFRLRGAGGLQMKGIEGRQGCRVVVSPDQRQQFCIQLNDHLEGCR